MRIMWHTRGAFSGETKEIRLSPADVVPAYEVAQQFGFEPLATGLSQIGRHVTCLAGKIDSSWLKDFLEKFGACVRSADFSMIAMQRDRFKPESRELVPALTMSAALSSGITPAWEPIVSE